MKQFIIMGDIIDSRNKNQNQLMENFKFIINEAYENNKNNILSPLTITLGDEFQGVVKDLPSAINIILNIEENIIANKFDFKLRYVLNEGEIETPINNKIAHEMLGSGLTDARYKLTELKRENSRFIISIQNKFQERILSNAFKIYENIVGKWNLERDYEIAANFIKYADYKIVSELLKKNRSLLWKREKTLNINAYNSIKDIIKTVTSTINYDRTL